MHEIDINIFIITYVGMYRAAILTDHQIQTIPASSPPAPGMGPAREPALVFALVQYEGSQCNSTPRRGRAASQGQVEFEVGMVPGC